MAKYGAYGIEYSPFAEVDAEDGDGLPVYDSSKKVNLGALQTLTDSFNEEEARLDGDNLLEEHAVELTDGSADIQSCQLTQPAERILFGLSATGDLEYGTDTNPPWGGVTFKRNIRYHGTDYYQGIYYPKAKAQLQGEEDETRGKSLSFKGDKLRLLLAPAKNGKIKIKSPWFTSKAAVADWCASKHSPSTVASTTGGASAPT